MKVDLETLRFARRYTALVMCGDASYEFEMEPLVAELEAARRVVAAGRELREESPWFYGKLKEALAAYDAVTGPQAEKEST